MILIINHFSHNSTWLRNSNDFDEKWEEEKKKWLTFTTRHLSCPFSVFAARMFRFTVKQITHVAVILDNTVNVQVVSHHVTSGKHFRLVACNH